MSGGLHAAASRDREWAAISKIRPAEWAVSAPVWLAYRAYLMRIAGAARGAGVRLTRQVANGIKLPRRFTAGGWLGWTISCYLRPDAGSRFHFR